MSGLERNNLRVCRNLLLINLLNQGFDEFGFLEALVELVVHDSYSRNDLCVEFTELLLDGHNFVPERRNIFFKQVYSVAYGVHFFHVIGNSLHEVDQHVVCQSFAVLLLIFSHR